MNDHLSFEEAMDREQAAWLDMCFAKPIAFHRAFADIAGDALSGLFLSQAFYWSKMLPPEREGWFYKTQDDWREETGMTRAEQETARKRLRNIGVLEEKRQDIPAKLYYRVNKSILHTRLLETSRQDCWKPADRIAGNQQSITEITSENTLREKESIDKNLCFPGPGNDAVSSPGQPMLLNGLASPSPKKKRPAKKITPIDPEGWPTLIAMLENFELPVAELNDKDFWAALTYSCPPVQQEDWLEAELAKVYLWLRNNPQKRPTSRWKVFLGNWLNRAYEHYRKTLNANRQTPTNKRY